MAIKMNTRRGAVALLAALGLVVGQSPADAHHTVETGSGVSTGASGVSTTGTNELGHPLCLKITAHTQTITNSASSTYTATNHASGVKKTYTGTSSIVLKFGTDNAHGQGQPFYINPVGTFSDPACAVPALSPVSATVSGSNGANSVSCATTTSGIHQRVGTQVAVTFVAKCDVTDAGGTFTSDADTTHVLAGESMPCGALTPCPPFSQYTGVYTEN